MILYHVKLTFITPVLATAPTDGDIWRNHVATKAADNGVEIDMAAELATIPERIAIEGELRSGVTDFYRDEKGRNCLYDYMIKGFFKEACKHRRRDSSSLSSKLKAYKQVITGQVFPGPRLIPIKLAGPKRLNQRSVGKDTPRGPMRVLTASQEIPIGSSMEFDIVVLADKVVTEALLREWLDYGQFLGLAQWRSGGFGRFTYTLEEIET